jgi:DNA polymerase-3 subunit alpha
MENNFVHLHVKSEYSLISSSAHTEDIVKRAAALGQPAVALTDTGVMFGAVQFAKAAITAGIKPIIGMEMPGTYTFGGFTDNNTGGNPYSTPVRKPVDSARFGGLVLLAKSRFGYRNLVKIASARVCTDDLLYAHGVGLIALTGGANGRVFKLLADGFYRDARDYVLELKAHFQDVFIEMCYHGLQTENIVCSLMFRLSADTGVPIVAANDVRMTDRNGFEACLLLCAMAENTPPPENDEYYIKSSEKMRENFAKTPDGADICAMSVKIADMIEPNVIEFGRLHMPKFTRENVNDNAAFLYSLCKTGMMKRYGNAPSALHEERLAYELGIITRMGFADYFLIIWDIVKYAHQNGISVGPGRGSGAGSFAAYCIGITGIDPIQHNLLFERFLNPERVTLPDLDIDFDAERRHEVIEYAVRKYGDGNVAGIVTFMTIQGKSAVRSAAKLLHLPVPLADMVSKRIPYGEKLAALRNESGDWDEADPQIRKLLDAAALIEGYPKHVSTHASGIVLSDAPITDYAPTMAAGGGMDVTQFTMGFLEEVGLVKMDILGSKYLTLINDAAEAIRKRIPGFTETAIPMDDRDTYRLFAQGHTLGIFQFESEGITSVLTRLSPENIGDLIAVNALYRPGPMDSIPQYIDARRGRTRRRLLHPLIDGILDETYGFIVYQEQVMQIVQALAGFSLGQADILRRAMAKKKSAVMEKERADFLDGADKNGVPRMVSETIFNEMSKFSAYAFNKSHSAAYAYVAYRTAYLKLHFPADYYAALISCFFEQKYINEAIHEGIVFIKPDINQSSVKCSYGGEKRILFGLSLIKGMGIHPISAVIAEREKERFYSLEDFCGRFDPYTVPRNAIENLIRAGAFDFCGTTRRQMLRDLPEIMEKARSERQTADSGQLNLFALDPVPEPVTKPRPIPEFDRTELRKQEIDVCGIAFC